jgi:hypothetical protein
MGYSIQIRYRNDLIIPDNSGYVPPNPDYPNYVSFSGQDMHVLVQIMSAVKIVDSNIDSSAKKKQCLPGTVPIYKFRSNDGYVVTAKEAGYIAEVMKSHNISDTGFLQQCFPKLDISKENLVNYAIELGKLWTAFNYVAAANNGYSIK